MFVCVRELVRDSFRGLFKTIHGIMLVQYLKDNKRVFREALGGRVSPLVSCTINIHWLLLCKISKTDEHTLNELYETE